MRFIFEQIKTGGDRNFGYLLGDRDRKQAILVDPSYQPEVLIERAAAQGLKISHIINTHGHGDHTNGNDRAQELTGAKIAIYKDSPVPHDLDLDDGDVLTFGQYTLQVLYTPGHAQDHIVLYNKDFHIAITGDHLFVGKIGGTPSDQEARKQYDSFQRLLSALPDKTTIWPGHDYGCRPSSTLAIEKAVNPFLLAHDFDAFLKIKSEWSSLKNGKGLK